MKFSRYDNFLVLSKLNENDIQEIEKVAKEQKVDFFADNSIDYLGPFNKDPRNFFI